jgi:hypothetical protein
MSQEQASSVVVSVPGKVILMGEHAVVHGHTCIAAATDLRLFAKATVTPSNNDNNSSSSNSGNNTCDAIVLKLLKAKGQRDALPGAIDTTHAPVAFGCAQAEASERGNCVTVRWPLCRINAIIAAVIQVLNE